MEKLDFDITEEKLNELKKQTKEEFTMKLIEMLRKQIDSNESAIFKQFSFRRIVGLVEHENKRNKLEEFRKNKYKDTAYKLSIALGNKEKRMLLNGEFSLDKVSEMIQEEFDLEPLHLYEFEIGQFKFGPECDEWQEMFDSLSGFKLGAAISAAGLGKNGKFKFLYDFGDKIKFNIKIEMVEKLNLGVKNGKR